MLYITVDKSLYRIRLNAKGYHIPWARKADADPVTFSPRGEGAPKGRMRVFDPTNGSGPEDEVRCEDRGSPHPAVPATFSPGGEGQDSP